MTTDRTTALQWMQDNGAGYRRAAGHFGLNVHTVKSWQRRARHRKDDTSAAAVVRVDEQDRITFLTRRIHILESSIGHAPHGAVPGLMKQQDAFHRELTQLRDQARMRDAEFQDPRAMLDNIVAGLESSPHLLTADQVDRLGKLHTLATRLVVGERASSAAPVQTIGGGGQ